MILEPSGGGWSSLALARLNPALVRGVINFVTAEHLVEALAPSGGRPHHVEGLAQGRWVLLDYVDFVLHLFHPELRAFYELERLWGDAPVVAVGHPELKG